MVEDWSTVPCMRLGRGRWPHPTDSRQLQPRRFLALCPNAAYNRPSDAKGAISHEAMDHCPVGSGYRHVSRLRPTLPTGPAFVEEKTIPDGQALVYFYRPYAYAGSANPVTIMTVDGPIVDLASGGYFPYFTKANSVKFWAVYAFTSNPVTFDAVEGQTYYVKTTLVKGWVNNKWVMELVRPGTAKDEIVKCKKD